ncbi:MAG: 2OG-Fe(II) oxygenase [Janthinobacterium lividum]
MSSPAAQLASLLSTVQRPGDFFAAGSVELLPPSLAVEGVGPVALPLLPVQAEQIIAVATAAPFGRGEQTLVDPAVRRCWQIGPDQVRLGGRHWERTLDGIVAQAAEGLGVDGPVTAEFYKLLLYGPGGFFVGHRDTEKAPGMFATLVIALPSIHAGGELIVRHMGREAVLDLHCEDPAEAAFTAFYADCIHEVRPVTEGHRLILTYNLVRRGKDRPPEPPSYVKEQARVAALLRDWCRDAARLGGAAPRKLVYRLEHAYTPAELEFAALKGPDAAAAGVLAAAAPQAGCDLHLALLTVEESGAAEYNGSYGRGRWDDEDQFEASEVLDRTVRLSEWRGPKGKLLAPLVIPVNEEDELSPPGTIDDFEPDEEHFREATGNEGASFERTYCRAALVLWPGGRLDAVLTQAGLNATLPYLEALAERWTGQGEDHHADVWGEAHGLARQMLEDWPRQGLVWSGQRPGASARMLAVLARLDDTAAIERFLTEITAAGDFGEGDNDAVIAALGRLPPPRRTALIGQVVAGTAAIRFAACTALLARAVSTWPDLAPASLAGAGQKLLEAMPGDVSASPAFASTYVAVPVRSEVKPGSAAALLSGLCAVGPALAESAVAHMLAWPAAYGLDAVLVPTLRTVLGAGPVGRLPALGRLRDACISHLRARVAEPLEPPADWRRASSLPCGCERCAELASFLEDPGRRIWVFKAAEANRSHVEGIVKQAECDVDTATDRRGRPYSLVLTKNSASYEQRVRQRQEDLKDLGLLER